MKEILKSNGYYRFTHVQTLCLSGTLLIDFGTTLLLSGSLLDFGKLQSFRLANSIFNRLRLSLSLWLHFLATPRPLVLEKGGFFTVGKQQDMVEAPIRVHDEPLIVASRSLDMLCERPNILDIFTNSSPNFLLYFL